MCDKSLTLFVGRCYGDDWHSVWLSAKRSWTEPFWVRMMSTTTPHALGERAQIILKTLIDRFIREGEPVGSRTIARESGLDLSPASIRNALLDLEELEDRTLEAFRKKYEMLAQAARKELRRGVRDTGTPEP